MKKPMMVQVGDLLVSRKTGGRFVVVRFELHGVGRANGWSRDYPIVEDIRCRLNEMKQFVNLPDSIDTIKSALDRSDLTPNRANGDRIVLMREGLCYKRKVFKGSREVSEWKGGVLVSREIPTKMTKWWSIDGDAKDCVTVSLAEIHRHFKVPSEIEWTHEDDCAAFGYWPGEDRFETAAQSMSRLYGVG